MTEGDAVLVDSEEFKSVKPAANAALAYTRRQQEIQRHQRLGQDQEAAESSAAAAENCTGRPGTMVEMACL